MGTCKECKWWGKDGEPKHKAAEGTSLRACSRLAEQVFTTDSYAEFYTDPDFGCVKFEARNPAIDIGKDAR